MDSFFDLDGDIYAFFILVFLFLFCARRGFNILLLSFLSIYILLDEIVIEESRYRTSASLIFSYIIRESYEFTLFIVILVGLIKLNVGKQDAK